MNAIARLLARASGEADYPPGTRVVRSIDRLDELAGTVAFVDDGWIYWAADDGSAHASRPEILRRLT